MIDQVFCTRFLVAYLKGAIGKGVRPACLASELGQVQGPGRKSVVAPVLEQALAGRSR